ncbi:MAG: DUF58 domain-containing protein [Desulfosarcina sp.]
MTPAIVRAFHRFVGGRTAIPASLGLGSIYILPTGYGLLYLTVLGAMLIGSINYNNNLGFLLTFLLGSLGLTAMMHTYGMLYGLRLTAATARPVFAGESVEIAITVDRIGRPRKGICWSFNSGDQIQFDLKAGPKMRIEVPASTDHRGRFDPGRLHLRCDYPLGLFRAWSRIETDLTSLVYPRPAGAPEPGIDIGVVSGNGSTAQPLGVDDFNGLSAYQPGDPPRRIHWQSYSRGRGLFTKSFAGQVGAGLVLDMNRVPGEDTEKKLSILCFHVLRSHRQRRRFGMRLSDQTFPVGAGRAHRDRCLRALALFGES